MVDPFTQAIVDEQIKQGTITLTTIPKPSEIKGLTFNLANPQVSFDARVFSTLLSTANPIDARNPTITAFHLSPWVDGTFTTEQGTFEFSLFLAGRGRLTRPDGKFGWFDFRGNTERAATPATYPDFLVADSRRPVTTNAIEASSNELQLVVFKMKRIEWLGKTAHAEKDTGLSYESGKAEIELVDVLYSENARLKKGDTLWLMGERPRERQKYAAPTGTGALGTGNEILLLPDNRSLFLAMLKQAANQKTWEAERIQVDLEDAWSGGKPLAGFRDQLRSAAEKKRGGDKGTPTKKAP